MSSAATARTTAPTTAPTTGLTNGDIVAYRHQHPTLTAAEVAAHFDLPTTRVKNALRKAPKLSETEKLSFQNQKEKEALKKQLLGGTTGDEKGSAAEGSAARVANLLAKFGGSAHHDPLVCFGANVFGNPAVQEAVVLSSLSSEENSVTGSAVQEERQQEPQALQKDRTSAGAHSKRTPSYRVEKLPGKGFGCVAARRILPGEVVIAELPIVQATEAEVDEARRLSNPSLDSHQLMVVKLETLQKTEPEIYAEVLELADHKADDFAEGDDFAEDGADGGGVHDFAKKTLFGILQTNTVGLTDRRVALHLKLSRFNHSCCGNLILEQTTDDFDSKESEAYHAKTRLKAVRTIERGEELCFAYITLMKSRSNRRKELKKKYGFLCDCKSCGLANAKLHEASSQKGVREKSVECEEPSETGALGALSSPLSPDSRPHVALLLSDPAFQDKAQNQNLLSETQLPADLVAASDARRVFVAGNCSGRFGGGKLIAQVLAALEAENWYQSFCVLLVSSPPHLPHY